MSSRTRDLARILGKTEASNTTNAALTVGGETSALDVFDTLDSLPISGISEGQRAFVEENNRLYISNGSGWYNISLVNQTPTWATEPDASYSIADSVTPLVITALATDSDNPDKNLLNQSIVTDSAQYLVTITNDSSVWTFTPKSADSIGQEVAAGNLVDSGGDFIYTFKWSDGISFVAKEATITYGGGGGAVSATGFTQQLRDWGLPPANMGGSNIWPGTGYHHGTRQAPDGKYYMFGYFQASGTYGGWLAQLNEDGTFSWVKAMGSYSLRIFDIEFDGNDPIVLGYDDGWGQNFPSYSPTQMYMAKFNGSGTRQWSKVFRNNTISSNSDSTGNSANDIRKDSMGNFWSMFNYGMNTNNPVNYTYTVPGLMKFNGSGALQGVYLLPPSGGHHTTSEGIFIDESDNLYMSGRATDPNSTSYPHGVVHKFALSNTGVPSYAWSKLFGQNSGGAHYDIPTSVLGKSSDGNLIVSGYTQQSLVNNDYWPTIMKMSDTDGSFIWKKRYDNNYGQYGQAAAMVNGTDVIWLAGETYNQSSTHYEHHIRTIDASDGSHIAIYEFDFDGQANTSVDNSGSYTWSGWRFGDPGMAMDNNGNAILTNDANGNGFDYRPTATKLPSPFIAGTFGGGAGTYSGNTVLSVKSVTPTDYTYDASVLTYASWSTVSDQTSGFSMVNYNSGAQNDTVFTPTLTSQHGAIT